jgi:hypothetical protein
MDIILQAPNIAAIRNFAFLHGLTVGSKEREGVEFSLWGGTGKFLTAANPPTFAPGVVVLVRFFGGFLRENRLRPLDTDPGRNEQWSRHKLLRRMKQNGTTGTTGGIPWIQLDGVRLYRPSDVEAFIVANNLPRHLWSNGNSYLA